MKPHLPRLKLPAEPSIAALKSQPLLQPIPRVSGSVLCGKSPSPELPPIYGLATKADQDSHILLLARESNRQSKMDVHYNRTANARNKPDMQSAISAKDSQVDQNVATCTSVATLREQLHTLTDPLGFLSNLLARSPVGFAAFKPTGHLLMANPALATLIGVSPTLDYNIFNDPFAQESGFVAGIRRAFAGEASTLPTFWYRSYETIEVTGKATSKTIGGRKPVALSASLFPIFNTHHIVEYVAVIYRDDSQIAHVEQSLKEQSEQFEQRIVVRTTELQAANEELEAFSYSISHDLRAPLRVINALAELVGTDTDSQLSTHAQDYMRRIHGATTRMSDMINDLLDFSRLGRQTLVVSAVTPTVLLQEVLQELQPCMHNRSIEILMGNLPSCQADASLLREVFLNLLDNAIKFTRKCDHARIKVGAKDFDGRVVWSVIDNGVGFDMSRYDRLFGVFNRLHTAEEFEGTGVGLALVQRIVKRHGGAIWAHAEPNKGASFYFTLGG